MSSGTDGGVARLTLDGKPMDNLLILYKLLYALGCRIDGIDFEIDRLCLASIKRQKHSRKLKFVREQISPRGSGRNSSLMYSNSLYPIKNETGGLSLWIKVHVQCNQ